MYERLLTPDDHRLRTQFETRTFPPDGFRHREHVRLTWIYLTADPVDRVAARLCRSLEDLATSHGAPERFHHTLTVVWVRMIAAARCSRPDIRFDDLVAACPALLDKDAPLAYYTRDRLYSDAARRHWVEPNLQPLPAV